MLKHSSRFGTRLSRWLSGSLILGMLSVVPSALWNSQTAAATSAACTPTTTGSITVADISSNSTTNTCLLTATGDGTFTLPSGVTSIDFVAVGGGGAGGGNRGGGGGAGGLVASTWSSITALSTLSITIGAGGSGTGATNGSATTISIGSTVYVEAAGGGAGGDGNAGSTAQGIGRDGRSVTNTSASFKGAGSGGGAMFNYSSNNFLGGSAGTGSGTGAVTPTIGGKSYRCTTNPSTNDTYRTTGGGGGAGSAGGGFSGSDCSTSNPVTGNNNGGAGAAVTVNGYSFGTFAAGGGGADGHGGGAQSEYDLYISYSGKSYSDATGAGTGGSDIGGRGGKSSPTSTIQSPSAGQANTGSGGGGGTGVGEAGGSGVVKIKYTVTAAPNISITNATQSITYGSAISTVVVTNAGGDLAASNPYSISPVLPAGLVFSPTTGSISGTPTSTQSLTTYTITAAGVNGLTSTATFSLTVNKAQLVTPAITSVSSVGGASPAVKVYFTTPSSGTVTARVYSAATGGTVASTTTSYVSGNSISVANAVGPFYVTIQNVGDTNLYLQGTESVSRTTVVFPPAPAISGSPYTTTVGNAFTTNAPTNAGGALATTGTIYTISPTLPSGLSLDGTTGVVSGTPLVAISSTTFTETATGSTGLTGSTTFSLTINKANLTTPSISTKSFNSANSGISVTFTSPAGGTVTARVYSAATGGTLLKTVTSYTSGSLITISGFSSTSAYYLTLQAIGDSNYNGDIESSRSTIAADPSFTLAPPSPISAKVGEAITSITPTLTGGPLATTGSKYTLSQASSIALPTGLSFDTSTGVVSGTPTSLLSLTTFTIRANGIASGTSETSFSLEVNKGTQTLSFTSATPTSATVKDSYTVTATGGVAGTSIIYSIEPDTASNPQPCSLSGNIVTFDHVGTCIIHANKAGTSLYDAAAEITMSFTVSPKTLALPGSISVVATSGFTTKITAYFTNATDALSTSVFVYKTSDTSGTPDFSGSGSAPSITVEGLDPATTYYVVLRSNNMFGSGSFIVSDPSFSPSPLTSAYTVTTNTPANAITITSSPSDTWRTIGQTLTLGVVATGNGTLSYDWQFSSDSGSTWSSVNGSGITRATIATDGTLTSDMSNFSSGNQFKVVITNTLNGTTTTATTTPITLTISPRMVFDGIVNVSDSTPTVATSFSGYVGTNIGLDILVSDGRRDRTYSISSGSLPAGLTLFTTAPDLNAPTILEGYISGTPTTVGTSTFVVTVTDANGFAVSSQTITVTISKGFNVIQSFGGTIFGLVYGGPAVTLNANATSGLPITYVSATPLICGISGNQVTPIKGGTCKINATQPGSTEYLAATTVQSVGTVNLATQSTPITFSLSPTSSIYNGTGYLETITPTATGGNGTGMYHYSIVSTDGTSSATATGCQIDGQSGGYAWGGIFKLTATSQGTCMIRVEKVTDYFYYNGAEGNIQTFTFSKGPQTISFTSSTDTTAYNNGYERSIIFTPTFTGTGAKTYAISNGTASGCALDSLTSPSKISATSAGTCLITLTIAADDNYVSATSPTFTYTFTKAALTTPTGLAIVKSSTVQRTFDISWNSVSHATSYNLYWYQGSTLKQTFNVSGTSRTVSYLDDATMGFSTTFGFKVAAVGDSNYETSTASATVSETTWPAAVRPVITHNIPRTTFTLGQSINFTETGTVTDGGSVTYYYQLFNGSTSVYSSLTNSTGSYTINFNSTSITRISLHATNALYGFTAGTTLDINVTVSPSITYTAPSSGLTGQVGVAYSLSTGASGGSGGYSYALASGSLPGGVTLNTSTGVLSGTPTTVGNFAFVLTATDTNTASASTSSFTIAISAGAAVNPTFGSVTRADNGFTVSISNYDAALYTYTLSSALGSTLSRIGAVITVAGLADGATDTITVTASRSDYLDGVAAVAGTANYAGLIPTLNTITRNLTRLDTSITNYDANYVFKRRINGGAWTTVTSSANFYYDLLTQGTLYTITIEVSRAGGYKTTTTNFTALTKTQGTVSMSLPGGVLETHYNSPIVVTATTNAGGNVAFTWKPNGGSTYNMGTCTSVAVDTSTMTASCTWTPTTIAISSTLYLYATYTSTNADYVSPVSAASLTVNGLNGILAIPSNVHSETVTAVAATIVFTSDPNVTPITTTIQRCTTEACTTLFTPGGTYTTSASFLALTGLTPGTSYYYKLSASATNYATTAWTSVLTITTLAGPLDPIIDIAPVSTSADKGQTFTLHVTARTTDGGVLSYNWGLGSPGSYQLQNVYSETFTATAGTLGTFGYTAVVTSTLNGATKTIATTFASVVVYDLPIITSATLSSGTVGVPYTYTFSKTKGSSALTYTVASGSTLPDGLTLSSDGVLSGTPTTYSAARQYFYVSGTDTNTGTSSVQFSIPSIAKGTQGTLSISSTSGTYPSMSLSAIGGNGTGTVTYATSGVVPEVVAASSYALGTATSAGKPMGAVISPDGSILYSVDGNSSSIFRYDTVNKVSLSALDASSYTSVFNDIAISNDGKFLIAGTNTNYLLYYNIEKAIFSRYQIIPTAMLSYGVAVSADSNLVFVSDATYSSNRIYKLQIFIDSAGVPTFTESAIWRLSSANVTTRGILLGNSSYIYAAVSGLVNGGSGQYGKVFQVPISSATGTTFQSQLAYIQDGSTPSQIALSPDGARLIATNSSGGSFDYLQFSVNKSAFTTPAFSPAEVQWTLNSPLSFFYSATAAFATDGTFALVVSQSGRVRKVLVNADGTFGTATDLFTLTGTGLKTRQIVMNPNGSTAYINYTLSDNTYGIYELTLPNASGSAGCTISGSAINFKSAGTCKVVATKAADSNWLVGSSAATTITVSAAAAPTITAGNLTAAFTNTPIVDTSTVTGLVSGDAATVSSATYTYVGTGTTVYNSTSAPTAAGTYDVTPSAASLSFTSGYVAGYATPYNYVAGTLTITPPPAISLTASSTAITKQYGASQVTSVITATLGTGAKTFTLTSAFNGSATSNPSGITLDTTTAASAGTATLKINNPNVGVWTETVTATDTLMVTAEIAITVTMTQASITVTSKNVTKTFGAADPVLTGFTITSGVLVGSDTFTVTATRASGESAASGSNQYTITPSNASFTPVGALGNYAISYATGTLTINALGAVTITAVTSPSPTYNGSAQTAITLGFTSVGNAAIDTITSVTYTITGNAYASGTDTTGTGAAFTGSVGTPFPTSAGVYRITPSAAVFTQAGGANNYSAVTYSYSTFTINRATRTETATVASSTAVYLTTDQITLTLSAGSGDGAVTYTSLNTAYCTVNSSGLVTMMTGTAANLCQITVATAKGANYEAPSPSSVTVSITPAKANQSNLYLGSTYAVVGTNLSLYTFGGSGTGTYSYILDSGSGCTLNSSTLSRSTVGTCLVTATKIADGNYLATSSLSTAVNFYVYVAPVLPAPIVTPSPIIQITKPGPTVQVSTNAAPTITSFTPSSAATGGSVVITGTGYTGATNVKIGRKNATFVVNSSTQITATVPTNNSGASGVITVTTPNGSDFSTTNFTWL